MAIVEHAYQKQTTGYYCGPASTRVALSAGGVLLSQDQIAKELGTTTEGTASIHDVTRVLDAHLGAGAYADVILPTTISQQDVDTLFARVKSTVDDGGVVVVNGAGPLGAYSYPGGHYVAVTGYDAPRVFVSDVAAGEYWVTVSAVAHWAAAGGFRGYAYKEDGMLKDEQLPRAQRDAATALDDLYGQEMHGASNFDGGHSYRTDQLNRIDAGVAALAKAGVQPAPVDIDALADKVAEKAAAKLGDSIAEQVAAKLAARLAE
ncbi:MAG TPA: C39 family peptidase [Micromonosporaceae bacterium]